MSHLVDRLWRPVDIASLVAFRVAFGALALVAVLRHVAYGWVEQFFIAPQVFFPYPGFEWIKPLPAAGMYALYGGLALSGLGILLGAWTRASAALFCLGFTYAHLIDRSNYLNHYYLISMLSGLLVFLPSGRACSIDAWRRGQGVDTTVPQWTVALLRFQLAVVYVFGAVAKLNADWLLQAEPLRIWLGANVDVPLLGPWLEQSWVAFAFSYAGLLFDASIVPLLLWSRTRALAYSAVLAFHLLTALLFPIGMFPWLMIALTPVFFAPDWPRALLARISGWNTAPRPLAALAPRERSSLYRRAVVGALGIYALIQVVVPLRHLVYAGDLYWSESGFRWSWQIMVMEKFGRAVFTVADAATGERYTVRPLDELTALQYRMLATQPDMLLTYAHRLRDRYASPGRPVRVFADVTVTLNGRPAAPLVDPAIDLAALPEGAPPSAWLLPHPDAQRQLAAR